MREATCPSLPTYAGEKGAAAKARAGGADAWCDLGVVGPGEGVTQLTHSLFILAVAQNLNPLQADLEFK